MIPSIGDAHLSGESERPGRQPDCACRTVALSEIGSDAWNRFVEGHPLGSIYHHAAWHKVIEETYGYRGRYLILCGNEGSLRAALPLATVRNLALGRRIVSYPFSDVCDPLVRSASEFDSIGGALHAREGPGQFPIEIRTCRLSEVVPGVRAAGNSAYSNFVLSLDQERDRLFGSFHKSCVRRAARQAERRQVEVLEGTHLDDLTAFYRVHVLTRKKLGLPAQPYRFFRNLWDILRPEGLLTLFLARSAGRVIAGIVLLHFRETVYYKFGASDARFLHLRPNQLLMWRAIEWALERRYRSFDLGRTFKGNTGLMTFKRRWGAVPRDLTYVHLPRVSTPYEALEEGSCRRIASRVLRTMPAFVARWSGELLYRYLA